MLEVPTSNEGSFPTCKELTFNRHQGLCLGSDSNLCNTFSSGASILIQLESNIRKVQRVKLKAEAAYGSLQTTERVVSKNIKNIKLIYLFNQTGSHVQSYAGLFQNVLYEASVCVEKHWLAWVFRNIRLWKLWSKDKI